MNKKKQNERTKKRKLQQVYLLCEEYLMIVEE
jgi:hypothetical protein